MRFKLQQTHISDLLQIENPFHKRDYIQDLGIEKFRECKGKLICTWATALGKTVLSIKIIKKVRQNFAEPIHITVPTDTLKEQWETKLEGIENVFVYTIHSYLKQSICDPILLICDECHIGLCNPEGTAFNKINQVNAKFKLYLSATLKRDQLDYLKSIGLKDEFKIGIEEAILLELVPPVKIYNVYVPFTDEEKKDYVQAITNEQEALRWFEDREIEKIPAKVPVIPDENPKLVTGMFYKYLKGRSKRISLVSTAKNKEKYAIALSNLLGNRKVILFSTTQKQATNLSKLIKNCSIYHTGLKDKVAKANLEKFTNNEILKISSVGKLIAGLDDECTDSIIRISFHSTESGTKQSLGKQNLPK